MIHNKIIIGAMLVSQQSDILDITIPNMLKWSDWVLILMDNQTKEVEDKIYKYQTKYYNKIFVRRSSIPDKLIYKSGEEMDYRRRWKAVKGIIRDEVFINLRRILDMKMPGYDKIDILIWPDHDEIFTDYLPELLNGFISSDYKAITMKPVEVVGDMRTIRRESMGHHVHIMKYSRDLAGLPWRFYAIYFPLVFKDLMRVDYYSVHLAYLNDDIRGWRNENWKKDNVVNDKLYKLDKDAEHLSPEEIRCVII